MNRFTKLKIFFKQNYKLVFVCTSIFSVFLVFQNCGKKIPQYSGASLSMPSGSGSSATRVSSAGDPVPSTTMARHTLSNVKCNDGSAATYYFRPGTGAGANRWVIWLQGGGGCGSSNHLNVDSEKKYSCPLRAVNPVPPAIANPVTMAIQILNGQQTHNALTSSNSYLPIAPEAMFQGILSKNPNENPDFYSYNHVAIPYCSSDLWSASNQIKKWTDYDTSFKWHYQGRDIISATMASLVATKNLYQATNLIWSGESAGGMGAAQNTIEVKAAINPATDMVALIDGIFEMPETSPVTHTNEAVHVMSTFMDFSGATPTADCLAQNANSLSECVQMKNVLNAIRAKQIPFFITRDQFDIILNYYANTVDSCTSNTSYLAWMENHSLILRNELAQNQLYSGVYSTRSANHTWTGNSAWKSLSKQTSQGETVSASSVFGNWYFNRFGTKIFIQDKPINQTNLKEDYSINCSQVVMPNN